MSRRLIRGRVIRLGRGLEEVACPDVHRHEHRGRVPVGVSARCPDSPHGWVSPEFIAEAERAARRCWTYNFSLGHSSPLANRSYAGMYTSGPRPQGQPDLDLLPRCGRIVAPRGRRPSAKTRVGGQARGSRRLPLPSSLDNCVRAARPSGRQTSREVAQGCARVGRLVVVPRGRPTRRPRLLQEMAARSIPKATTAFAPRRSLTYLLSRFPTSRTLSRRGQRARLRSTRPRRLFARASTTALPVCRAGISTSAGPPRLRWLLCKEAAPAAKALSDCLGNPDTRLPALRALGAIGPGWRLLCG